MIDSLEARRLLTDFASLNGNGTLSVVGTSNNDSITIDQRGSNIIVRRGSQSLSFASSAVKRFWVNAFRGNDRVTINVGRPSSIIGSSGNDTLTGGTANDLIVGGYGSDRIDGRDGIDRTSYIDHTISVNARLIVDASNGLLKGDGGRNDLGETDDFLSIEELEGTNQPDGLGILRTEGAATIAPGLGPLSIFGLGGSDGIHIVGFQSDPTNKRVFAGSGSDIIRYTGTNNYLFGEADVDLFGNELDEYAEAFIHGGSGFDVWHYAGAGDISNGLGIERLYVERAGNVFGTNAAEVIQIAGNVNSVNGAAGDDLIEILPEAFTAGALNFEMHGGDGNDTLIGGAGDDVLDGGTGSDRIEGRAGNDSLVGNAGADRLFGGSGNDTLVGGAGRDLLHGQDGDDRIFALDNEIDTLDGGAGFDRAQRDNAAAIVDSASDIEQFT